MLPPAHSGNSPATRQNQIVSIQVLRGIAALMVCFLHFTNGSNTYLPNDNLLKQIGSYGGYGVQIFFVISGFILPYAMSKSGYKLADFGHFMVRRIARLDPPFVLSIIVVVLLAYLSTLSPVYRGKPFQFNWVNALLHLGYLNAFFGRPWLSPVYWTLAVEFQFYVILGLVFPLFSKVGNALRILLIGILLSGAFWVSSNAFIFYHAPLFFMGISSFLFFEKHITLLEFLALILACTVVGYLTIDASAIAFGLASVAAIFLVKTNNRTLIFFGTISYSLYLIHQPVGSRVVNLTETLTTNTGIRMFSVFIAVFVSVVTAAVFYRFVELPAMRWSKTIAMNSKRPAAAAIAVIQPVGEKKQEHV
jgi:peptidoglycan/LPS O-acetylase OafA/YrhL